MGLEGRQEGTELPGRSAACVRRGREASRGRCLQQKLGSWSLGEKPQALRASPGGTGRYQRDGMQPTNALPLELKGVSRAVGVSGGSGRVFGQWACPPRAELWRTGSSGQSIIQAAIGGLRGCPPPGTCVFLRRRNRVGPLGRARVGWQQGGGSACVPTLRLAPGPGARPLLARTFLTASLLSMPTDYSSG